MLIKYMISVCLFWAIFFKLGAQNTLPMTLSVQNAIDSISKMQGMETATWGAIVIDTQTGAIVAQHDANRSMVTASVMKVITTATALSILGKDFQFSTVLSYSGEIKNGVLNGNLYLQGGGDPSLGSDRLGEALQTEGFLVMLGNALKKVGIQKITGDIIGDGTLFDNRTVPDNWVWGDIGNYYGAGVSGLNLNENLYNMVLRSGQNIGDPVSILFTEPDLQKTFSINNEIKTGDAALGDNAYIYCAPFSNVMYVRGTIPPSQNNFHIRGSITDPELFAAQLLCEKLGDMGIDIVGVGKGMAHELQANITHSAPKKTIYTHKSPPLSQIIQFTNQESINLYAEALLKMVGLKQLGKGSTATGLEAISSYWKAKGLDTKGMLLKDGSGLSPNNAMTASQIGFVLQAMIQDSATSKVFLNSLAVAGKSGTISDMCEETEAEGKIYAKSGYISGVRTYAGYVDTKSNKRLTFVLLANYYNDSPYLMKKRVEWLFQQLYTQ